MLKKFFLLLTLITALSLTVAAQLQSPEQFLGYKLGSRYTPHWRIVDYYKHVAAAAPGMVKLQTYGQTTEGRPLLVAFISAAPNIANLESIRTNNLSIAQMGGTPNVSNAPAIVWLSYNVHGNEPSSSEAAMLTLYTLVDPANTQTKTWLQNTVVVMDPCLNPDGRDRYVSWFTSVTGETYNPSMDAREHREPWPGGRTNHYNFDLNRDWAWQTQIESQQRLKLYNQWLPQIHVDFHEQGVNAPYYFAPAAQPFHEVITDWQRNFQHTIGRNHARYFDERGWLYFTREVFDLLYPSYGDTYPLYNGSIGMTYEQGGGPAGGAAALTDDGDTLTLLDRILHHHTTGWSTLEVASKNAQKLVSEFGNFYKRATTDGVGNYKSYIIKYSDGAAQKIQALLNLLQKNEIKYGVAKSTNARGYNFTTGREENFTAGEKDIVISTVQPKGTLVNVLFEPNTKVVDSNTYDITAWALPYAFGLQAFASRQNMAISGAMPSSFQNNTLETTAQYGYVIPWDGMQSVRLVAQLLQKGIKLRMSEQPFDIGGKSFNRGSVIVLKTSNQYYPNLWNEVRAAANEEKVFITPVSSGFVDKGYDFGSAKVHPLKERKIAMFTGEGIDANAAGEVWHYFEKYARYPITLINVADAGRMNWSNYDVVIMPNGNYRFLTDKTSAEVLKSWITQGGNLIAMESAVAQLAKQDWAIKAKKNDEGKEEKNSYEALRKFEDRERDYIPNMTPGSIFRVEMDATHPLAFGFPGYYYTLKLDDALYEFIKEGGWNVGVLKKDKQVAGFVGSKLSNRLQDGLLFGTQDMGRGNITYLTDDVLFRNFWESGKLLFSNAVFLVGQ